MVLLLYTDPGGFRSRCPISSGVGGVVSEIFPTYVYIWFSENPTHIGLDYPLSRPRMPSMQVVCSRPACAREHRIVQKVRNSSVAKSQ